MSKILIILVINLYEIEIQLVPSALANSEVPYFDFYSCIPISFLYLALAVADKH